MPHDVPGPRPKESIFYDPTIYLIGRLCNFKPYIGVSHNKIQNDVLRLAGFTLINDEHGNPTHATDGTSAWKLKSASSKKRDGLYRVAHFAWYHQTRQYRPEAEAMCAKSIVGARGDWALTALGAKKAKELRKVYEGKVHLSSGPNATAQFLGENFGRLYDRATHHLRRKMPRSEMFDKVDDHVMNWVDRVIQRDGLRSRIEEGKSIAPSQVCAWARRGAYTDIRNEGREPAARVLYGALTPKEVQARTGTAWITEVIPRSINESEVLCGTQYTSHSEDGVEDSDHIELVMDQHATATVEETFADREAFEVCLDRLSSILHEEIAEEHDPAWHERLVHDHFIKEMSVREIAKAHGLSSNEDQSRIKTALNRVRDVMLQAREDGDLDDLILR